MLGEVMSTLASEALLAADNGTDMARDIACYMLEATLGDVVRPMLSSAHGERYDCEVQTNVRCEEVLHIRAGSAARHAQAGCKAC